MAKRKRKMLTAGEGYELLKDDLQPSQVPAFDDILQFFRTKTPSFSFMLLSGSAGTGKTYLIGKVAEYLQRTKDCNILLCAPTNKAVKVLRTTLEFKTGMDFSTIHSALGLKEEIDDNGNIIFKNQNVDDIKIYDYDYVILDEASMVDDELFAILLTGLEGTQVKVLFVGDKFQIPPVNYIESTVFAEDVKLAHNIKEVQLTKIIRQHKDNPIIGLANDIKDDLSNATIMTKIAGNPDYRNSKQVIFVPQERHALMSMLETYFLTDEYDANADHCKVLAWTNECVNKFNTLIRKMKYGANVPQLVSGEKIIFDRPWVVRGHVIYSTNEEVTARYFDTKTITLFNEELEYYDTAVSKEGSMMPQTNKISILKVESYPAFERMKLHLKNKALAYPRGSMEAKGWWSQYYLFMGKFAAVKYNYAITVHKAQGSTYDHAIVANYDINKNFSVVERNRIKYTAVTRPRENLYIIV